MKWVPRNGGGGAGDVRRPSIASLEFIAAVMVHVPDVPAGISWYEKAFPGIKRRYIEIANFHVLVIGNIQLEIVQADEKVSSGAAGSVVYWQVADFDKSLAHWLGIGAVLHRGPMKLEGDQFMCQVRDPWGNCIGLRGPVKRGRRTKP